MYLQSQRLIWFICSKFRSDNQDFKSNLEEIWCHNAVLVSKFCLSSRSKAFHISLCFKSNKWQYYKRNFSHEAIIYNCTPVPRSYSHKMQFYNYFFLSPCTMLIRTVRLFILASFRFPEKKKFLWHPGYKKGHFFFCFSKI